MYDNWQLKTAMQAEELKESAKSNERRHFIQLTSTSPPLQRSSRGLKLSLFFLQNLIFSKPIFSIFSKTLEIQEP